MGAIFGGHSTVWILLIWSLELSPCNVCNGLLEVYEKECQGTTTGLSSESVSQVERYNAYRKLYENCTLIRDNLEIVAIHLTDAQYDFSFLETIREVNGYVLIYGNYVDRIRLNGLRVIRGFKTYAQTINGVAREFSLYVAFNYQHDHDTIGLKELQLTSLVEIIKGNVAFENNAQLCFGEKTIEWERFKLNNQEFVFEINSSGKKRACDVTCHQNCARGDARYCWAEGPDMCQAERPCGECRRNCSSCSCSRECIGGCTGSDESSCMACKNFLRDVRCVENCKAGAEAYNRDKSVWEYPPTMYMHGSKCVTKCPENMLIQNEACVTKCIAGYMENKTSNEKKCVPCRDGICPKTCGGVEHFFHSRNLAEFNQCTKVEGNLMITSKTFLWHMSDPPVERADLEILRDVDEITGRFLIEVRRPDLTSLSFLRNLRVIGGIGTGPDEKFSLTISRTSLMTLDLKSLRQIKTGGVVIYANGELCYAHTINWTGILTSKESNQILVVKSNANSSICEEQGLTCSELCSDSGCWGPGDDNCVSCRNYSMKGRCVTNCTMEHGFYTFTTEDGILECGKCHEECHLGCTGDGPDMCNSCRRVRDNDVCLSECPVNRYNDSTGTCQWCDGACRNCSGNSSQLGKSGCDSCRLGLLLIKTESEKYCMQNATDCDQSHFWSSEFVDVGSERVQMKTCRKCHPECDGCKEGNKSTDCIKCRNYRQTNPEKIECVNDCSYDNGYYYSGKNECMPCAKECKQCKGPSKFDYDCSLCQNHYVRIRVSPHNDRTEKNSRNNTFNESFCDAQCPPDQPNTNRDLNDTESFCSALMVSQQTDTKSAVSIVVVFFLVIVVVVVVGFAVFWRKQKLRRLRESALANDEIPMINATKAKPDMSLLRLVKESELRRGNMIGSGAFGTVYKGVWIPEKENVKIPVAIKVLLESSNTSQNVELLDEARIMASVCHPNCVRILAVCMTAQLMLITQLMPLGCLLDYVRKEKSNIGCRPLLLWSVQIAKGMKYLEDLGIVHRDLAARNVLVQNPNQVKITDFGLAKLLDYEEAEIHSEGGKMPIKWLALECIQHRIYTHKSDVWSYGVTLWEMFTYGERPYENLAARQIPQALEKGERLPQPYICTIDVYMFMIKCWVLDVDSRPTFSDLVDEFTRMAQDPGRFLVIPGDKLMRLPSNAPDAKDLIRLMSLPVDEPDLMIVSGEEYLRPMDMDLTGDSSSYPPTTSPLGPLTSIPEDDTYENTRPMSKIEEYDDDLESPSRNGKINSQYSREPSQRYCDDPCRSITGQMSDPQKKGDVMAIRVDEEGYLTPQSTIAAPSYLDVVDSPENDSQNKQNPLNNQPPLYLDMRPGIGLAKDNPEYYDDDTKNLTTSGSAGSNKMGVLGVSGSSNETRLEYCNVPSSFGNLALPYSRLPESDI